MAEAHLVAGLFEFGELFEGGVANDGQVLLGRLEILAEGENIDMVGAEILHDAEDFVDGFAETEHEA